MISPWERFEQKFVINPETGCWDWKAAKQSKGYGCFGWGGSGKSVLAHRWIYEHFNDVKIPEEMTIDHLCKNKGCVNPEHMEIVTRVTNSLRGSQNAAKTHCLHGHSIIDPANVKMRSDGRRTCLACRRRDCEKARAERALRKVDGKFVRKRFEDGPPQA